MPLYLKQSTASQEVPLGFFVDSTDGNTEETGLTIANTDIKVWKTGATTLANKNSGGGTHISNGVYYAVLDATDTNTLGSLVLFCHVSGALPIRVECVVLAANVYDSLIGGGDVLDVSTTQFNGTAVTQSGGRPEVNVTHAAGTAWASGAITASALAADAITAAKVAADVGTEIGTAVWATTTRVLTAGTNIALAKGTGVTGFNDLSAAQVNAECDTAIADAALATAANLATVDNVVDAILLDTGTDGVVLGADAITSAKIADNAFSPEHFSATMLARMGVIASGTAQSASGTGIVLASAESFADDVLIGATVLAFGSTQGYWQSRIITDNALSGDAVTVDTWTVTPSGTITYIILATPPASAGAPIPASLDATQLAKFFSVDSGTTYGSAVAGSVVAEIADNAGGSALTAAAIADAVWDEATSGHTTSGTFGEQCKTDIDAILVDTGTTLDGRIPAALVSGRMDVSVGAMAANVMTAAAAASDLGTEIGTAVWATTTRVLTAGTNIALAKGTGVTGFNDLSAAQVNTEVDTALTDIHLDHLLAATYDPASKPGAADALLNELVESDGGVARYTANALEQAPSGGGGGGDATEAKQDTIIALIGTPAADLAADIAAVKAETALIVEDTGTTLPATLATIDGIVDDILTDTGTTLPATLSSMDTDLTNIEADTQNIQGRIPAALVSGRMNSNVAAINDAALTGDGTIGTEWGPA